MAEEDILKKKGPELFRELLRVYPVAEVEDYFKNGAWREDVMRVDLQLVDAHRREAGAPDPVALEDVKMPEMPKTGVVPGVQLPGAVRPPGAVAPTIVPAGGVRPMVPTAKAGAVAAASGPVAELRLIALFVAKWKLDPTRTKMMLAKMTPQRRRYIIQTFKTTAQGAEATAALEQYLAQCEKTNAWGAATTATPGVVTARPAARPIVARPAGSLTPGITRPGLTTAGLAAGIKRPLTPVNPALDPSKRPRLLSTGSITPKAAATQHASPAAAALAARLAAQRPRAPGVVTQMRPGMSSVRPGMGAAAPRPVAPTRPQQVGLMRPAMVQPKAKAAAASAAGDKRGELIRNLLQRF